MAPKMVHCCICGQEVTKKSTLMLNDGRRACRTHEGVETQSRDRVKKENNRRMADLKKHKHRHRRKGKGRTSWKDAVDPNQHCWFCRKEGMRQDLFFHRVLVEQEKWAKVHGRHPNPFNADDIRNSCAALVGIRCLWVIRYRGDDKEKIDKHLHRQFEGVPVFTGWVLICPECSKRYRLRPPEPKVVKADELPLLMALGEAIREEYEKQAVREMGRDN